MFSTWHAMPGLAILNGVLLIYLHVCLPTSRSNMCNKSLQIGEWNWRAGPRDSNDDAESQSVRYPQVDLSLISVVVFGSGLSSPWHLLYMCETGARMFACQNYKQVALATRQTLTHTHTHACPSEGMMRRPCVVNKQIPYTSFL